MYFSQWWTQRTYRPDLTWSYSNDCKRLSRRKFSPHELCMMAVRMHSPDISWRWCQKIPQQCLSSLYISLTGINCYISLVRCHQGTRRTSTQSFSPSEGLQDHTDKGGRNKHRVNIRASALSFLKESCRLTSFSRILHGFIDGEGSQEDSAISTSITVNFLPIPCIRYPI